MIAKSYIFQNLQSINRTFLTARSYKEALFLSKLAILELCGWIEESMDDLVMTCAIRHLKQAKNRKYCKDQFVRKTYGFEYDKHFRFMLIRLLGLVNVERIEARVDQTKRDQMMSALSSLVVQRNTEAHTHLRGTTRKINAPSVTMAQFPAIYDGLIEYDTVIRRRRW